MATVISAGPVGDATAQLELEVTAGVNCVAALLIHVLIRAITNSRSRPG